MVDYKNLRSMKQLVDEPGWPDSMGGAGWGVFNAKQSCPSGPMNTPGRKTGYNRWPDACWPFTPARVG